MSITQIYPAIRLRKKLKKTSLLVKAGYKPIRIMFYFPNRTQAIKIQETLKTMYKGIDGEYHFGENAWNFVKNKTNVDLLEILKDIANKKPREFI